MEDYEYLKVHGVMDMMSKFNFSWLTAGGVTLLLPSIEAYLPIIIQLLFIIVSQVVAFSIDLLRLKLFAHRTKTTVKMRGKKLEMHTDFEDDEIKPL